MLEADGWTDDDSTRMIRLLLANTKMKVRVGWTLSPEAFTSLGVPQGDGLSGLLFIAYLTNTLKDLEQRVHTIAVRPSSDSLLGIPSTTSYADDVDFFSTDTAFLEQELKVAADVLPDWNLTLNVTKTERTAMFLFPTANECVKCSKLCSRNAAQCDKCNHWWHYCCVPLDHATVKRFETDPAATFLCPSCMRGECLGERGSEPWRKVKHLGSLLDSSKDIELRIARANAAFASLNNIWRRKNLVRLEKRLHLFQAFVMPHLTYNIGAQAMNKSFEERLDIAHRKMVRRVLGIFYPNRISNENLYRISKQQPISATAKQSRWRLFGHLLRQDEQTPANKITKAYFRAKESFLHRRGTKRTCLMETLRDDIQAAEHLRGLQLESESDLTVLRELAHDRDQWKELCRDVCSCGHKLR